jgi:hypothetical protein
MAIANPRIHMICGICGNNKMLSYKLSKRINDTGDTDEEYTAVTIICDNCSSITDLDEIIDQEK